MEPPVSHSGVRIALSLAALLVGGCSTTYLPNTDVEDTPENRKIVEFCEQYRKAVELRDVPALLSLVSPRYYDDGGDVRPDNDIDYAGLKQYLTGKYQNVSFQETAGIRHEIRYRRVTVKEKEEKIFVDYTYSGSFRMLRPDGTEKWDHAVEENRLELVPEGETFKILSGL
jgi:hypothetical protein